MKKIISFLLVLTVIFIVCISCAKEDVKTYTVTIYRSSVNARGFATTSKIKTITVKDGDVIGQIDKGRKATGSYDFKGFFTEKTAVAGQEWNPAKDEVHSDLEIYAVWEYNGRLEKQ